MQKRILDYRVTIEKEGKKYNAYCPFLDLADFGKTIDEAVKRIKDLISFHIESLEESGKVIPVECESTTVITSVRVPVSSNAQFSCA